METQEGRMSERGALERDLAAWTDRSRIVLTPIAAPSIMGLTGFMLATLMVGAWQAGWYGGATTPLFLWPLALFAGGLLQSIAAVMSFRARDGLAVAVHTAWGSFWLAWGVLQLLVATGVQSPIPLGTSSPSFAFWFIGLTLITVTAMMAALATNLVLSATLAALAGGAAITAAGFWAGNLTTLRVGGWFFVISAALAWLAVTAMVLEHSYGRTVIPLGAPTRRANVPGHPFTLPVQYGAGMPGSRVGH
jgi:succinate-acetate transporter protein